MLKRFEPRTAAPVLSTESKEQYEQQRLEFRDDIKPQGAVERMYCDDISDSSWDIKRLRRIKVTMVNMCLRSASRRLLVERLHEFKEGEETIAYLRRLFSDEEVRDDVAKRLAKYNLDESAIEADAYRYNADIFMRIDRLIASAEARRDKALAGIAFYRASLALRLRNKIVNDETRPRIEAKMSPKMPPARG